MKSTGKLRVAVLYGGRSAEHEVSLQSAKNVMQYLDPDKYEVFPVGISKQGTWFLGKDIFNQSLIVNEVQPITENKHAWFSPESLCRAAPAINEPAPQRQEAGFDVIFPAVHGSYCEDGCLQGLLELADVPYVGSGVLASAVGMDKEISKLLAIQAGIPVAPFLAFKLAEWQSDPAACLNRINSELTYPLFVKPANTGSSIGISKIKQASELTQAINEALKFDRKVVIENGLDVIELEMAVLESMETSQDPIVSVAGEVKPSHEFYSYDAKYTDDYGAELIIPASVSESDQKIAKEMAKQIFNALDCEGMARIDLFYDKQSGKIYFNEINTLPGFTKISMYPKLMDASGLKYSDLLSHLVQLAIRRHKQKKAIQRSYQDPQKA